MPNWRRTSTHLACENSVCVYNRNNVCYAGTDGECPVLILYEDGTYTCERKLETTKQLELTEGEIALITYLLCWKYDTIRTEISSYYLKEKESVRKLLKKFGRSDIV